MTLTTPTLEAVSVDGSADVVVRPRSARAGRLALELDGSGGLDWQGGEADALELEADGSGDLRFVGAARDAKLSHDGSGGLDVRMTGALERLELASDGSGDVRFSGSARTIRVAMHGSGDVRLEGGRTARLDLEVEWLGGPRCPGLSIGRGDCTDPWQWRGAGAVGRGYRGADDARLGRPRLVGHGLELPAPRAWQRQHHAAR